MKSIDLNIINVLAMTRQIELLKGLWPGPQQIKTFNIKMKF